MDHYEKFKIKDYQHWSVYIHEDQTNLGRTYIWCNREDALDFLEMTDEEKEEFFEVAKKLKTALTELFQPDLFNYASLGNITNHIHVHVIPRYANPRTFEGATFEDKRWGQSYRSDPDFKIPEKLLMKLKEAIRAEL